MEIKKRADHPDVAPYYEPPPPKPSAEYRAKYAKLFERIQNSPTSREPSPDDVESFAVSYRKCGLHIRLGPLPTPRLEETALSGPAGEFSGDHS